MEQKRFARKISQIRLLDELILLSLINELYT